MADLVLTISRSFWSELYTTEVETFTSRESWSDIPAEQDKREAIVNCIRSATPLANGWKMTLTQPACEYLAEWLGFRIEIWRDSCDFRQYGAFKRNAETIMRKLRDAGYTVTGAMV